MILFNDVTFYIRRCCGRSRRKPSKTSKSDEEKPHPVPRAKSTPRDITESILSGDTKSTGRYQSTTRQLFPRTSQYNNIPEPSQFNAEQDMWMMWPGGTY